MCVCPTKKSERESQGACVLMDVLSHALYSPPQCLDDRKGFSLSLSLLTDWRPPLVNGALYKQPVHATAALFKQKLTVKHPQPQREEIFISMEE